MGYSNRKKESGENSGRVLRFLESTCNAGTTTMLGFSVLFQWMTQPEAEKTAQVAATEGFARKSAVYHEAVLATKKNGVSKEQVAAGKAVS